MACLMLSVCLCLCLCLCLSITNVLNNRPTSLNSNQYTWRHNSLLQAMSVFVESFMPRSWNMTIDLPGKFTYSHQVLKTAPFALTWLCETVV